MQRKNKQQWLALIEQFEASGLSQVSFCKKHDLNPKYFSLKRSKLATPSKASGTSLVRATLQASQSPTSVFTLFYGHVTLQCDAYLQQS